MKIKKIKKVASGKYNLILDNNNKISTYDDVIIKNNVLYKKEIDFELLSKINEETSYYKIYNKVLNLINLRIRSKKEIIDYLNKNNIDVKEQKQIINQLEKNGLINDYNFIKCYISDKVNLSNIGPNKIRMELLEHNLDENTINEELNKIDNNIFIGKIDKIVNKKINANSKYSNYILKQKLINELINLGFYKEDIISILNDYEFDNDYLLSSNYDKLYKTLSLKYEGNVLSQKIKEKLYKKGFSISEIDNIINKKMG